MLPNVAHDAHNLIIEEPGVVYINDTHRTVVRQYDLASGKQTRAIDIKKMPGGSRILAICQLDDKIRLARGESTSNINVISKFIEQAHEK